MTQPDPAAWIAPRERAAFDGYARLYGAIAVLSLTLSFIPLFNDVVEHDSGGTLRRHFGNLYETSTTGGGGPAMIGILLLLILIGVLVAATFRPTVPALPVAIVVLAALIALMLLTKPGTGDPAPDLSYAGTADAGLAFVTMALGAAHFIHLRVRRGQRPPRPPWQAPK